MSKKTPLYECHLEQKAVMADFAGFLLPLRFESELKEHESVRNAAGMFDVSHMGEFLIKGKNAKKFLQYILSNNIDNCHPFTSQYSLLLNDEGGIIDDLIVYNLDHDEYLLCVNASNIEKDFNWVLKQAKNFNDVECIDLSEQYSQIALQGPNTFLILKKLGFDQQVNKNSFCKWMLQGAELIVAATGYTGEQNGVEIFVPNKNAEELWKKILSFRADFGVLPCGLSSRDTLRIEAGLLLFGVDMDESITPLEAGLMFAVDVNKNFIAHNALALKKGKIEQKLFGFSLEEKGIARSGYEVFDLNDKKIGRVTSGSLPSKREFALGFAYLDKNIKNGDHVFIQIRNKKVKAIIRQRNFLKN